MKIIDLSHLITEDMPVYPGSEQPILDKVFTHDKYGFCEHRLTFFSHTGTHVDAPGHIIEGGKTLDQMDVDKFCGSCCLIDFTDKETADKKICIDELADYEAEINNSDFLIVHTGWARHWGTKKYFTGYPALAAEAARWLVDFNLKGVGLDTISIDTSEDETYPVHNILLETGMIIIENLTNLHHLHRKEIFFSCMPLKHANADGSPVRAVAFIE